LEKKPLRSRVAEANAVEIQVQQLLLQRDENKKQAREKKEEDGKSEERNALPATNRKPPAHLSKRGEYPVIGYQICEDEIEQNGSKRSEVTT